MTIRVGSLPLLEGSHLPGRPRPGEGRGNAHHELARRERLGDVVVGARVERLGRFLLPGARREHDDGRRPERSIGAERLDERDTVEPGHHHVAEDQGRRRAPDALEGCGAVADGLDGPPLAQDARDVLAHVGVVVGKDDTFPGICVFREVSSPCGRIERGVDPTRGLLDECPCADGRRSAGSLRADERGRKVRRAARDSHAERRAGADTARDADVAAMQAHELLDEREADAGSLVAARPRALDAVEAFEEPSKLVLRDARSRVGDLQDRAVLVHPQAHSDRSLECELECVRQQV